ncbi:hypothetical protein [Haloarcula sp. 1CSR25-25]|uniref:hypothetical protein n=1 Tax=Haloarcula sp. 1CSR25-25 TaxID=2862545 RepID=UPI00289596E1|nr:hypothetical protein [Haloarcula sp. 1CSR25-25]MDT3434701.1 hypothetical protein [Haloarcula sp. 1CSR25-25]
MQIGDISTIGCVKCQIDFNNSFATDTINVPQCPSCGTLVDGFEDQTNLHQRNLEAYSTLEDIKRDLRRVVDAIEDGQNSIPEGSSLPTLNQATQSLKKISRYAAEKNEELNDSDS